MKGWLDNFGKADNANESKVSMSEDFVGLGYDTKGRNYSPAWGGQFQKGGQLTPVSPLQQVQQAVQPTPTVPYLQTKNPAEFYKSWIQSPEYARRQLLTGYSEGEDLYMPNAAASRESRLGAIEEMTPITYSARQPSEAKPGVYGSPSYVNINPSDYIDTSKEAIQAHELAHIAGAMGEIRPGMMSAKEQEIFKKSMLPMKEPVLSGVQGSKEREASKRALEDWKHSQEPDEAKADLDALRFMMYDKGIYDITKGKKFTETDFEKAKQNLGKDRVFKRLENRMGKKNFVNLMNTIALADEEEAPIAMGGMSIPGSVGFSYARVAGAAPSKGKYAKKTMASAQMGDNVKKDETNIDTGVANKIAALELQQNPDYQHWKYLQSLPQLRQAPGRGEELMRKGLGYADVATDVMQMGNFIPHPTAQAVGKVGNIAGSIIDGLQAADEAYRGNYLNAGINLASAALPAFLDAKTFRRNTMMLRPGDPLYSLTEQARRSANSPINLKKTDTDYLELFSNVKGMQDKSLMYNRVFLGGLGVETAYDVMSQTSSPNVISSSDIEGVYPNFNIELENPKSQSLPTKTENADPAIAKKLADYMKSKSRENTGEVYGRKSYYPIDGFQNGGEMRFYQNGLDWKPRSMQDGGEEDLMGKATKFLSEKISGPVTEKALGLLNMVKPISNPEIYKTVRPVDYPNALKLPVHAYNYIMGNESEPLKTKSGKPHLAEEFWATAMGMPVEKQYLKESQYKPSKSKDPDAKYYTIRDVIDDYQLMSLTKDLKPGQKMEMNGLSPILDTKWYSENANTDKNVKFADIDPLQRYTLEKSPDGSYVSIYDKYDFNNPALNRMMNPIEIYDRFYLPKKKDGGSVDDKKNPLKNKDVDRVSVSDPRYAELYKNRQVGAYYDDAYSLPDLDEVTVTAPRSYTMDSLRDLTTAALYGAPANAMKLSMIPQAAMTEGIEALRGNPYDFSNVNPNFGGFTSNQRDLSQTMGYENPEGFLQNAANIGLSMIDPAILMGGKGALRQPLKQGLKKVDIQKSGFPNPLRVIDSVIPRPLAPGNLFGLEDSWNNYSPLNLIPGYGKRLVDESSSYPDFVGFRKFGNSIDDVIESQSLRPRGSGMGSQQTRLEGNWAESGRVNENYPGVFEATMNPKVPGSNIQLQKVPRRSGILGTTKEGDVEIPLTDPGLSFNRRLPFSNRYVSIDKDKLINDEFQMSTLAPSLQSLAEKYAIWSGLGAGAGTLGYSQLSDANEKYIIDPAVEKYKNLDERLNKLFGISKKKDGGIIKDNEGYWNPDNWGQPVEIDSNNITMEGVYEPLLGVSDTGDAKLMKPGKNYKFKGKKVTEFPVAKLGINQLDAQPMKKLNQLLNFTNNPDKDNWLDKYN